MTLLIVGLFLITVFIIHTLINLQGRKWKWGFEDTAEDQAPPDIKLLGILRLFLHILYIGVAVISSFSLALQVEGSNPIFGFWVLANLFFCALIALQEMYAIEDLRWASFGAFGVSCCIFISVGTVIGTFPLY